MAKHETRGRPPIPAAEYLAKWSPVAESLRAGMTVRAIKAKCATTAETVRHVRRFMLAGGWTQPRKPVKPKKPRPPRIPKPPTPKVTQADLILKYPEVVRLLRAGKFPIAVGKLSGVSPTTAVRVRQAMRKQGEKIEGLRGSRPRPAMTRAELLEKHASAVFWLKSDLTMEQVAKRAGVCCSTVQKVKRAMRANGEEL